MTLIDFCVFCEGVGEAVIDYVHSSCNICDGTGKLITSKEVCPLPGMSSAEISLHLSRLALVRPRAKRRLWDPQRVAV